MVQSASQEQNNIENPRYIEAVSLNVIAGGSSEAVAISSVSAQSAVITTGFVVVTPTVDCFFRSAINPTALSNGTDQILLGGNSYRITGIASGDKLAFITTSANGTCYVSPGG